MGEDPEDAAALILPTFRLSFISNDIVARSACPSPQEMPQMLQMRDQALDSTHIAGAVESPLFQGKSIEPFLGLLDYYHMF